jgi:class 3 adenylate cyclase
VKPEPAWRGAGKNQQRERQNVMLRVGLIPGIRFPLPVAAVAAGLVKDLSLNTLVRTKARVERRLAAILAVDVAGYSRLMGADEEGTLAALRAVRRELGDPKIAEHRGRIPGS